MKMFLAAALIAAVSFTPARAATFTEDFEAPFPAWESGWFGTQSNAASYYCGVRGCTDRGNNPDGLWVVDLVNTSAGPINVVFNSAFGATLTSFSLGVADHTPPGSFLRAYDSLGNEIYAQPIVPTGGGTSDPGIYDPHSITSTTGISRFTFDGISPGNVSIDNLVAVSSSVAAIPEPSTYALMLAGLGFVGFVANRRRKGLASA